MTMTTDNLTPVSTRTVADAVAKSLSPASQNGKLLIHLLRHGNISQLEALELYRIHRLASRIKDLKNKGVSVVHKTLFDPTGVRYVRYALV